MRRTLKFYLGVWLPISACWCVVTAISAATKIPITLWSQPNVAWKLLAFSIVAPFVALIVGASQLRDSSSGSLGFLRANHELGERELFRLGIRKGLWIGPFSVVMLAAIASLPYCLDRIFTALGK